MSNSIGGTTLYAEYLNQDICELKLYEAFSQAGHVLSINLCREETTRQPLGCAYITFTHPLYAARALKMNWESIQRRPMLKYAYQEPHLMEPDVGDDFLKNLEERNHKSEMDKMHATPPCLQRMRPGVQPAASQSASFIRTVTPPTVPVVHKPPMQDHEPLTSSILADTNNVEQKKILGDKLYAVIKRRVPYMAGRITLLLLKKKGYSELLHVLENQELLKEMIDEMLAALPCLQPAASRSALFMRTVTPPTVTVVQKPAMQANMCARPITGQSVSNVHPTLQLTSSANQGCTRTVQQAVTQQAVVQQAVHIQDHEPLTSSILADTNKEEQKKRLGDKLYTVIKCKWFPSMAGKITRLLLETKGYSELLHVWENQESLKEMIDEMLAALPCLQPAAPVVQKPAMQANMCERPITDQSVSNVHPTLRLTSIANQGCTRTVQQAVTQQAVVQQAVHIQDHEPLTSSILADTNNVEQKKILGAKLYAIIKRWFPYMAGRITLLLLETKGYSELLHALGNRESLKEMVNHAVAIFQAVIPIHEVNNEDIFYESVPIVLPPT